MLSDVTIVRNLGISIKTVQIKMFIYVLNADCINCVKAELPVEECGHRADDPACKSLCKEQEKIKSNLNLQF